MSPLQEFKATEARLIDKKALVESAHLVYEGRITREAPSMQAGDFYFRPQLTTHEVKAPWYLRLFGVKSKLQTDIVETIVISCPFCGLPILTSPYHKIVKRDPLTIENAIACPYSGGKKSHSFTITEGKIMSA